MRKLISIFLLLASTFILYAQPTLPPLYNINSDSTPVQNLDIAYYQVLEDEQGKWTYEQVTQLPLATRFHYRNVSSKEAASLVNIHWFRYRFKNAMDKEIKI